jgi:hypothetical protein
MRMRAAILTPILALTLLSSCSFFYGEAGNIEQGDFGNATMQNTLVASGKMQPPMSDDKYDASTGKRLVNGKYMAAVSAGYVASAGGGGVAPAPSGQ